MFLKVHFICIVQFCRRLTHEACISGLVMPWTSGPVRAVSLHPAPILGEEQQLHSAPDPAQLCLGFEQLYAEHWQTGLAGTHPGFSWATWSWGAMLSGQKRQILLHSNKYLQIQNRNTAFKYIHPAKGMTVTLAGRTWCVPWWFLKINI